MPKVFRAIPFKNAIVLINRYGGTFVVRTMNLTDVKQKIFHSFSNSSKFGSAPRIINLLNKTKSEKKKAIEQAYLDFLKGNDSVLLLSSSVSSKIFHQLVLRYVPSVWFVEGRVAIDQNKRKDVIALLFTHQKVVI